jgi:hypothetical protein
LHPREVLPGTKTPGVQEGDVSESAERGRWAIHDWIAGTLGGGGLGAIAGLFLAVRVFAFDAVWGMLGGLIVGAFIGVRLLVGSHRQSEGFLTPMVVAMWILAVCSGAFIYFLYEAIREFQ